MIVAFDIVGVTFIVVVCVLVVDSLRRTFRTHRRWMHVFRLKAARHAEDLSWQLYREEAYARAVVLDESRRADLRDLDSLGLTSSRPRVSRLEVVA